MNLFIDNKSGAPIYDQIYTQIKNEILNGNLQPDEALPSIRALARDLRISVITTKRAYEELEREGLIVTAAGKGCFVAERSAEWLREGENALVYTERNLRYTLEPVRRAGDVICLTPPDPGDAAQPTASPLIESTTAV